MGKLSDFGRRALQAIAAEPDGIRRGDPWNWPLQQLRNAGLIERENDGFASYRYRITPAGRAALASATDAEGRE